MHGRKNFLLEEEMSQGYAQQRKRSRIHTDRKGNKYLGKK